MSREENKMPAGPPGGPVIDRVQLDDSLFPSTYSGYWIILDNTDLPSEADRKNMHARFGYHDYMVAITSLGQKIDKPFTIANWKWSFRQLLGEIANCGIIEPVGLTTDGKIQHLELASGTVTEWITNFRKDIWFNKTNKWIGLASEVSANLPGVDPAKILAARTTRIGAIRLYHLPDWYDDVRSYIKHLRIANIYEAIKV